MNAIFNSNFLSVIILGTKSVGKAMKAITEGAAKWQEKKWFSELVDKRMNSTCFMLLCS